MTNQEAFDKVVAHLFTQRAKSVQGGECRYRMVTEDGEFRMCAIGALIPANEYHPKLEGKTVVEIQPYVPALRGLDTMLLRRLQTVHDGIGTASYGLDTRDLKYLESKLRGIANMHGLEYNYAHT